MNKYLPHLRKHATESRHVSFQILWSTHTNVRWRKSRLEVLTRRQISHELNKWYGYRYLTTYNLNVKKGTHGRPNGIWAIWEWSALRSINCGSTWTNILYDEQCRDVTHDDKTTCSGVMYVKFSRFHKCTKENLSTYSYFH